MSEKIVDCFFIVEKSDPLKPAGPQSASQENAQYTAADLLSRSWEGRISYMNPVLSTDDLSPSTWIVTSFYSFIYILFQPSTHAILIFLLLFLFILPFFNSFLFIDFHIYSFAYPMDFGFTARKTFPSLRYSLSHLLE